MRRIIHNTTAIAACLSLMAPHLAMAQTAMPSPDQAAPQNLILAQAAPEGQVPPPPAAPGEEGPQDGADLNQAQNPPPAEPAQPATAPPASPPARPAA